MFLSYVSTLIFTDFTASEVQILNRSNLTGIRVVGKGSWKEREVGKSEVGKFR